MLFGAWTAKILAEVVRLDVPDALARGPLTADELVRKGGIRAHPVALHRALRADAIVGAVDARRAGNAEAFRRVLGRHALEGLDRPPRRARDWPLASARA